MDNHVSYPLSTIDSVLLDLGLTLGYVLTKPGNQQYDTAPLESACQRVAEKWPLVAARLVWNSTTGVFHLQVPTQCPKELAFKFTVATHPSTRLGHTPIIPGSNSTSSRPPIQYFRHSSVPYRVATYAAQQHPLIALHVSHLSDATCIGVSFPHGVFDATGIAQVLHAIGDELAGRDWVPPPIVPRNILTDALESLPHSSGSTDFLERFMKDWPKATLVNAGLWVAKLAIDKLWHGMECKALYLSEDQAQTLIRTTKEEAVAKGGWVSTGDILVAWFVKMVLADEANSSGPVSIRLLVGIRDALSENEPLMPQYPHNSMFFCSMRRFTHREISSMSIAELATHHRSHVADTRTPESMGAIANYLGPAAKAKPIIFGYEPGVTTINFSNQVVAGATSVDFGGGTDIEGFWEWTGPVDPPHTIWINQLKGGYHFLANISTSRWKTAERLLAEL